MKQLKRPTLHTLFGFIGVLACYIAFLALTNPQEIPISMLVIPSVLLGLLMYLLVRLLQQLNILKTRRITSFLVPIYAVLLSLLASLQQLNWRDTVLAGVLLWMFAFYYTRSRK